jgi:excisionase family DNA binding protein
MKSLDANSTPLVLLKAIHVAEILNISRSKAYQLMQSGTIPTIRINRSIRVRTTDLIEYIQKHWSGWKDQSL